MGYGLNGKVSYFLKCMRESRGSIQEIIQLKFYFEQSDLMSDESHRLYARQQQLCISYS